MLAAFTQVAADETTRSKPYQGSSPLRPLWQCFEELLPPRPYCSDEPGFGIMIRGRKYAVRHSHVQLNGPGLHRFLAFDIDRPHAAFADEDCGVAVPNVAAVNRANGHGHLLYALQHPVVTTPLGRNEPIRYLAAIERGMLRRLRADPGYRGPLAKNPLSPRWRVRWGAPFPYALDTLDGFLERSDKRPAPRLDAEVGVGRNVALFDAVRFQAYRDVLDFKRLRRTQADFQEHLEQIAATINAGAGGWKARPLSYGEVRSIARSVAKFCYRRFDPVAFSRIRSRRAETRTRKHLAIIRAIQVNDGA